MSYAHIKSSWSVENFSPIALPKQVCARSRRAVPPLALVGTVKYNRQRDCVSSSAPMTLLSKDSIDMMLSCTFKVDSGRTCIVVTSFPPLWLPAAVHRTRHDRSSGRDYQRQDALDNSVYPNKGILSFLPPQHTIPDRLVS